MTGKVGHEVLLAVERLAAELTLVVSYAHVGLLVSLQAPCQQAASSL